MNPIRRELLNGLFVLVVASLMSTGVAAFQIEFNLQLWTLIVMAVAIAVGGYVVFEFVMSNEEGLKKTEQRELEWLKRVGTPARLELNREGEPVVLRALAEAVKALSPGSDYTIMYYVGPEGGGEEPLSKATKTLREDFYRAVLEQLKRGAIREYKRIICFDTDVLANDQELKAGVLRVGEGPGTINRAMGEHCRQIMETKGCSLYVAAAVLRINVILYGLHQVSTSIEAAQRDTGGRLAAGTIFFYDPPNGEIVEQFRQMERETERRMVAVRKIVFPEDAAPTTNLAAR